jgi:predicted DNA-binding transcriptional regulator AlpA
MDLIMHTPTLSLAAPVPNKAGAPPALPETGFVRQSQVLHFVPFSKSTLWRRVGEGEFPTPVKLSVGITAWRAEDIRRWINERGDA